MIIILGIYFDDSIYKTTVYDGWIQL